MKYKTVPILAAILLALLLALMGALVRMMQSSFGTWQQVYLRILLAGIIAVFVFRKSFTWSFLGNLRFHDFAIYIIRAIFVYVFGVGFFTIAVEHAPLGTVSFISSLPILGLIAWILFRERVKLATLPYIGFSIVGLVLLTGLNMVSLRVGWGEFAAIICMLGFDIGVLMSRYHRKTFSIYQNTTLLLLVGWVPLFIVSMLNHEPLLSHHITVAGWVGLALSAIFNVVILYLINFVFSHMKAYVAGNLLLLEGVFAAVIGFFAYGEIPTVLALLGAAIILLSGYMISVIDGHDEFKSAASSAVG
jgi:drug/metabolite transporter (DMT)-like permease